MNMLLAILLRLAGLAVIAYAVTAVYEGYGVSETMNGIEAEYTKQQAAYARGGPPGGGGGPPGGGRGGRGGQSRVRLPFDETDPAQRLSGELELRKRERYLWFRSAGGELLLGVVLLFFPYGAATRVVTSKR